MRKLIVEPGDHRSTEKIRNYLNRELHDSRQMIRKILFYTGMLTFLFIFLGGCGDNQASDNNGNDRTRSNRGESKNSAAIPVRVIEEKSGDISLYLMQTTTIEAKRQVDIMAKVSGQVIQLPAEEGIKVKKGNLLAKLEEAELQIEYMKTKVSLETDKAMLERAQNMLEKNLIAEENYETTRLQYESSKAAHEAARMQMEYANIRAPFDGIITIRNIELGQRVNVNQSLFVIADFDPLRAKIYVPEKDIGRIYEGQEAKITIEAESELEFTGVVQMISPVVDPASGTSKVTIDIVDDKRKLKPGMFASVFITTETHKNVLIIPKKALILESDLDQVYIYQDGNAHKVNLQIGISSGDHLEVLAGLQEGDQVVTAGQDGLREGLPIRIPNQDSGLTRSDQKSN
jgi:membrane fusion protein (multidrug efflux system)